MYIIDKKTKQCVTSYIRYKYGANLEINRIYVFKYDYEWDVNKNEYVINKYKGYESNSFPERIPAKEIDIWGIILSRKEKIDKIRNNGSKQRIT